MDVRAWLRGSVYRVGTLLAGFVVLTGAATERSMVSSAADGPTPRAALRTAQAPREGATARAAGGAVVAQTTGAQPSDDQPDSGADEPLEDDRSLPTEQLVARGLPDVDRPWTAADYLDAVDVLERVRQANQALLPRAGSRRSGGAFARLVAEENLASLKDSEIPLSNRIDSASECFRALGSMVDLYLPAPTEFQSTSEVAELFGALLRVVVLLRELMVEQLAEQPNDAVTGVPAELIGDADGLLVRIAAGAIEGLVKDAQQPSPATFRIIAHLKQQLPRPMGQMSAESQQQIWQQLRTTAGQPSSEAFRAALIDLARALPRPSRSGGS